jgi:type IV/VI secretion system ImpK/VasF family protein
MTLLELCDPLFKKICLLNRLGRKGGGPTNYDQLRLEIQDLFKQLGQTAEKEPLLRAQWRKIEMPLAFFTDSMIAESRIPVADQWHKNRLAYDQKELAGDEKFFDLLDETLNDPSAEATERLQVFYTCIGLGFTGWYATQPEYLRGKMIDISHRIQGSMETDRKARLCPEAYQYLDTRDLVQPPGSKLGAIVLLFAGLCLIVFAVEIYLFRAASISLTDSLSAISGQEIGK